MYCPSTAAAVGILESSPTRCQIPRFPHKCRARCSLRIPSSPTCDRPLLFSFSTLSADPSISGHKVSKIPRPPLLETLVLMDLDPATAKLAIGFLGGPFFSAFGFLFILRIVMSWYPKLPVDKFPYVVAYAPTEPLLVQTRKLIPPLGGVDVTPLSGLDWSVSLVRYWSAHRGFLFSGLSSRFRVHLGYARN